MKLMYDEACLGEAGDFGELVEYLSGYDDSSFIGCEEEESWKEAVLREVPNLFSLGYNTNNVKSTHTHTLTRSFSRTHAHTYTHTSKGMDFLPNAIITHIYS